MADAGATKKKPPAQRKRKPASAGVTKKARPAPENKKRKNEDAAAVSEIKVNMKGVFAKDLGDMMFGYGDSTTNPIQETVDAVESIAVDFVQHVVSQCVSNVSVKGKIDVPDIQFVLRKDMPKAARAGELMIAKDRTKKFKSVGKVEDFDPETIEDALNVHE